MLLGAALLLLAAGGEEGGYVLEVAIAAGGALEADQVIEADGADADALHDSLDGAGTHLLVGATAGDLGGVEEVETAGGGAQGEVPPL